MTFDPTMVKSHLSMSSVTAGKWQFSRRLTLTLDLLACDLDLPSRDLCPVTFDPNKGQKSRDYQPRDNRNIAIFAPVDIDF